jgi:multicomponent Na+:H+ antiporter subunit E
MRYLPFILFIAIIYLFLTSNLEILNIILGLIISLGITILLKPEIKAYSWRNIPTALFAIIHYIFILIWDIIQGGIMVAKLAVSPKLGIKPAIISIPSGCETELAKALSAHAISISPGELVIEIDENGIMYTHVLDVRKSGEYRKQAQQIRSELLRKIFP